MTQIEALRLLGKQAPRTEYEDIQQAPSGHQQG
jgi:hypothetical protein